MPSVLMSWSDRGGPRLADALKTARVSQSELARAIGIHPSTVNRWLTGERLPDADELERACRHLGLSADILLGLDPGDQTEDEVAQRVEMLGRQVQALAKRMRRTG